MPEPVAVTIYHNPACGTSRNVLALIRNAGVEPTVIEYLKTPPDRATLERLIGRMGIRPRDLGTVPAVVLGGIGTVALALLWMRLFPTLRRVERLDGAVVH
jgi:Glutaredoxin